jgi:hypothetical protein
MGEQDGLWMDNEAIQLITLLDSASNDVSTFRPNDTGVAMEGHLQPRLRQLGYRQ